MNDARGSENRPAPVVLLKLGGSLLTDKTRPDTLRREVLERLVGEIARAAQDPETPPRLILGHGSGSFGHAAAARFRLQEGLAAPERLAGVPVVQERAAALHRAVLDALAAVGTLPFSVAPSSALVATGGRPSRFAAEPLALALAAGLLPVVYGDVVMDREQGCAICSTESVFLALEDALRHRGLAVGRALWAGATAGVLDDAGRLIDPITRDGAADAVAAARGAAGTDVTGGMLHRLDAALALARRGIPSLIFDGTAPDRLERALRGERVMGTRVLPTAPPE